ncbi:MAG TPA: hypothetical protein PK098_03020 [Phycisphaerales bacterium]|nr:hypothetical protein [Phycisphaerales bacterium]
MRRQLVRTVFAAIACLGVSLSLGGCAGAQLFGALAQNWEYQKLIEVLPEYSDLENRTVAVVVDANHAVLYQYPDLIQNVTGGVSAHIARHVPGARVLLPDAVLAWQYRTSQWNTLPYGEIAEQLNVDRVVFIDIYEFRLNPPGNRYEWEGVCAANVGIIERGGLTRDGFADSFNVVGKFPTVKALGRESADESVIQFGVLRNFIERTAWLFYKHEEPKYPDKYRAGK